MFTKQQLLIVLALLILAGAAVILAMRSGGSVPCPCPSPSASPSATPTPEPTATPCPCGERESGECKPCPTPTPSASATPTPRPTPTPSSTPTPQPTPTPPVSAYVGYGAATKGGAGGTVYTVTSLADSGAGSLRAGYESQAGPREYRFQVAGTIRLASSLVWKKPFSSILCSTAPAPGVTIEQPLKAGGLTFAATHDIIMDGCRSLGQWEMPQAYAGNKNTGTTTLDGDGGPITSTWDPTPTICGASNRRLCRAIMNGNTFSNSSDAGPDVWCGVNDVTLSHNLILDSFHPRSTGCDTVATDNSNKARMRITEYGNVYAYNGERQPKLGEGVYDFDLINNIVAFWQDMGTVIQGAGHQGGYGTLWEADGGSDRHNVVGSVWLPELGAGTTQGDICAADTNMTGKCRRTWDCYWGSTPKFNDEQLLFAKGLHYERNVYGKFHGKDGAANECYSTEKGMARFSRPYNLPGVDGMDLTAMEAILDAAGVQTRTSRESSVIEKVRAALRQRLQPAGE